MNEYSPTWYELFLQPIAPAQTEREAAFVAQWLPLPAYCTVLDLCCGQGTRHFEHAGRAISETKRMDGDRLTVALDYGPDLPLDIYAWQLFRLTRLLIWCANMASSYCWLAPASIQPRPRRPSWHVCSWCSSGMGSTAQKTPSNRQRAS